MRDARIFQIRRAILASLKDYTPNPCSLDEIMNHPVIRKLCATRGEVFEEWNGLLVKEYLETAANSGGEYCFMTGKGLEQINQEGDLDFFVWGKEGLRR